jgi:hypothetical protein
MEIGAKRAYLAAVKERYKKSSKKQKTQILNEYCSNCNYNRKHAIKLLSRKSGPRSYSKRVGAPRKYSEAVSKKLGELWVMMGNPCSTTLKEALPHWLPYDLDCDEEIKKNLLEMGSSTIERHLKPLKKKSLKGKSTTTPPKMKVQIPLDLLRDDQRESIGYFEADTVAHCGESLSGQFAWSLTMTDICTGWTENRASFSKSSEAVMKQMKDIENSLPFKIMGVATDNGSEFLNENVYGFLTSREEDPISFVRRRAYKKNDNAHVEQKNFTHVRNIFGYERFADEYVVNLMNDIYKNYWCPLKNFYTPAMKLKKKIRIGAKIKKEYDKAKTPYQRLMESGQLTLKQQVDLSNRKSKLNPFKLRKEMDEKLNRFYTFVDNYRKAANNVAA